MTDVHPLCEVMGRRMSGGQQGVFSICSAHPTVLETALKRAMKETGPLIIEATSNQVNQYGGYTGMTPAEFFSYVHHLAGTLGFPDDRLILGGDHLGPAPWQNESPDQAMAKAETLVYEFARQGFSKIHLDASMALGAAPTKEAPSQCEAAERTAQLCIQAERGYQERRVEKPSTPAPVYVIGTEVPPPGGHRGSDQLVSVTAVEDFRTTVRTAKAAFERYGLDHVWPRVIAVVVQPGVEFGHDFVQMYASAEAKDLWTALTDYGNLVFEAHSTDYQTEADLKQMVQDGFAILKVGPQLTFAYREALFALQFIADAQDSGSPQAGALSRLPDVLVDAMLQNRAHWSSFFAEDSPTLRRDLQYSLLDRCRYYWHSQTVREAVDRLMSSLAGSDLPLGLVHQFLPDIGHCCAVGGLGNAIRTCVEGKIEVVLDAYYGAIRKT